MDNSTSCCLENTFLSFNLRELILELRDILLELPALTRLDIEFFFDKEDTLPGKESDRFFSLRVSCGFSHKLELSYVLSIPTSAIEDLEKCR